MLSYSSGSMIYNSPFFEHSYATAPRSRGAAYQSILFPSRAKKLSYKFCSETIWGDCSMSARRSTAAPRRAAQNKEHTQPPLHFAPSLLRCFCPRCQSSLVIFRQRDSYANRLSARAAAQTATALIECCVLFTRFSLTALFQYLLYAHSWAAADSRAILAVAYASVRFSPGLEHTPIGK